MEERIINILLDIKSDVGGIKERMGGFEVRMDRLETDVAELKTDMSEVKSTVNSLADALLETSREVKKIKAKG